MAGMPKKNNLWEERIMKKLLALVIALVMILSVSLALADGIKVGIINLDPAESGDRQANVKNLTDTFTAENGYDATFVTAPPLTSSWKRPAPSSRLKCPTSWFPLRRPPVGTKCWKKPRKPASKCSCSTV